jgi:peptide deformylase
VGENIRRAAKVQVKAQDVKGRAIKINAEGWWARILQHEIDHINGILFLDRLDRPEDLREAQPEDLEEESALVE